MRSVAAFALVALAPAAVNTQVPGSRMIYAALCSGGTLTIPAGLPRHNDDGHCTIKGCHASCSRKRTVRLIDLPQ